MAGCHFLSGFTAEVAGTEEGVEEPQPTFSACFGAPFMPREPVVYAVLLPNGCVATPPDAGWSLRGGRAARKGKASACASR